MVGGVEALRKFNPLRMIVTDCPHCHLTHIYATQEGVLKVVPETKGVDGGRVA